MPLIALLQYLFIVKSMIRAIKRDIGSEGRLAFDLRDASAERKDITAKRKAKSPAERRKASAGRKY